MKLMIIGGVNSESDVEIVDLDRSGDQRSCAKPSNIPVDFDFKSPSGVADLKGNILFCPRLFTDDRGGCYKYVSGIDSWETSFSSNQRTVEIFAANGKFYKFGYMTTSREIFPKCSPYFSQEVCFRKHTVQTCSLSKRNCSHFIDIPLHIEDPSKFKERVFRFPLKINDTHIYVQDRDLILNLETKRFSGMPDPLKKILNEEANRLWSAKGVYKKTDGSSALVFSEARGSCFILDLDSGTLRQGPSLPLRSGRTKEEISLSFNGGTKGEAGSKSNNFTKQALILNAILGIIGKKTS